MWPVLRTGRVGSVRRRPERELSSLLPALPLSRGTCLEPAARAMEPRARLATIAALGRDARPISKRLNHNDSSPSPSKASSSSSLLLTSAALFRKSGSPEQGRLARSRAGSPGAGLPTRAALSGSPGAGPRPGTMPTPSLVAHRGDDEGGNRRGTGRVGTTKRDGQRYGEAVENLRSIITHNGCGRCETGRLARSRAWPLR